MAKLPILSGRDLAKILSRLDYVHIRTHGSHMILVKQTEKGKKTIPVPNHKELAKGTLKAIMNQVGLKLDDLLNLL
jgi:predicted RNA binding protein YcfA (HicA-like mRNA interferase family)